MEGENGGIRKSRRLLGDDPEIFSTPLLRLRQDAKKVDPAVVGGVGKVTKENFPENISVVSRSNGKRSNSSKASTANSQARRLRVKADIEAMQKVGKSQEEAIQMIKEKLETDKFIAKMQRELEQINSEDEDEEEEADGEAGSEHPEGVPEKQETVENLVKKWLAKERPSEQQQNFQKENTQRHQEEMAGADAMGVDPMLAMNFRLEKLLSRQSVPKELPVFNGDPEEWPMFLQQYQRTTALCGLSNDENIVRLQKCLKGRAREAVLPILGLPENVNRVMETLEMMFGRSDQIIKSMVAKVKGIPNPSRSKPETIILFSNVVANLVATMKNLNKFGHMYNPELLEQLVLKLSVDQQYQWCRVSKGLKNDPNLEDFHWWLNDVATTACLMPTSVNNQDKPAENNKKDKKMVLVAVSKDERKCCHCSGSCPGLKECSKFLQADVQTRWKTVKDGRVCYSCLVPGHRSGDCRRKSVCGKDGCERVHNKLLHKTPVKPENPKPEVKVGEWCGHVNPGSGKNQVLLRILPVKLFGPNGVVSTYAMLDEGSTITMVDSTVADELGLAGPVEPLCIQWTSEQTQEQEDSQIISLEISGCGPEQKKFQLLNARTVKSLGLPSQTIDMKSLREKWPYLHDIPFDSLLNAKPLLLIGSDNILLSTPRKLRQGQWRDPVATKTWLGWVVHGNLPKSKRLDSPYHVHVCTRSPDEDDLTKIIKHTFSTESFGVRVIEERCRSKDDKRAMEILEATTRRVGDRFQTGLLWKADEIKLPESRSNAMRRLHCLERKMDRNLEFAKAYCAKIEDYLAKGYCRKLSADEAAKKGPRTYYLPHFAVFNPQKPEKLRPVFDAAAKNHGVSLNDCLLSGPDLLNPLPAVVMRFRRHVIGNAGDVQEMFPQVELIPEDVDSQRFLWRGMERDREPDELVMERLIFGSTSSPASALYVKDRNALEFKEEFPETSESVIKNTFMDDNLHGGSNVQEACNRIQKAIELFKRGGFRICNWASSSRAVIESLPPDMRAKGWVDLEEKDVLPVERVLGLRWDPEVDVFTFQVKFPRVNLQVLEGNKVPTKREMASLVMSVYDPIGMIVHFSIKARILFQEVWLSKTEWDEDIPQELFQSWKWWVGALANIVQVRVPRCYSPNLGEATTQLHMFVDASDRAFAAVGYLRISHPQGVSTAFVAARARVAPLKALSIPRLELQAAVMGSRLAATIKKEIEVPISSVVYWSDSKTVISWIRSDSRKYKQFVAHRIGEIHELSEVCDWRWIPTEENVADEATRPNHEIEFSPVSRWYNGPDFLKQTESDWPKERVNLSVDSQDEELKKEFLHLAVVASVDSHVPDVHRFSSWLKLVRATAWVRRFAKNWSKLKVLQGELSGEEISEAQVWWWRVVQQSCFPEELRALRNGLPVPNQSKLLCLSPFVDADGVLRVKGRLGQAEALDLGTKHPVILHPKHPYTKLLLSYLHVKAAHQGLETVFNEVRLKYWVTSGRAAVKRAFSDCQWCKIRRPKPQSPEMGSLPADRLTKPNGPFEITGVDYFGPYMVSIMRKRVKRYGVLFTCMSIRAVHIEVAPDLSTDACINAIRRFVARRGAPKIMWSDNGTNFRGADRELRMAVRDIDGDKIMREFSGAGMTWKFNPPASPHMGGAWERLVRSVKVALDATLKEHAPREDTLHTLFLEAEFIVNNRPLTHVSVDADDPQCLTPNHFLLKRTVEGNAPGKFGGNDLNIRSQWKLVQEFTEHLWSRWVKEYLPTLTRRTKWFHHAAPIKLDDIVVVVDKDGPRNSWPLGRIINVYPGKDGQVRVVDVKTKDGVYRRPAAKICVLDIAKGDEEKDSSSGGRNVAAVD